MFKSTKEGDKWLIRLLSSFFSEVDLFDRIILFSAIHNFTLLYKKHFSNKLQFEPF